MEKKRIMLSHGSGGRMMHNLIKDLLLKKLYNPVLKDLTDGALLPDYKNRVVFTTDSFVVNPLFFPGSDIGRLAVCGTINDLVMMGAVPEYLSLALIVEEGLDLSILEDIIESIAKAARREGVYFVTGDIKVTEKGACDKLFINTSGLGRIIKGKALSFKNIRPGDKIIVTGNIAEHGLAVLAKRKELDLGFNIKSDCAALSGLLLPLLSGVGGIKFMRDPTRGGLATTLNEIAEATGLGLVIEEEDIPISSKAKAACELLGIDPLYVANEGKAVVITEEDSAERILSRLRKHPLGRKARIIGTVTDGPVATVVLNSVFGTRRIIDMLTGEPMPRIC